MLTATIFLLIIAVILKYFYDLRQRWFYQYKQSLPSRSAEEIYRHLCCVEFPFECFYGINLAFYRTFISPTIANVYTSTKTIASETEKRIDDTDILVHAWIDYGLSSEEGLASMTQLNHIHGAFKNLTRNEDFVFILCCLLVDTIEIIDILGWRRFTDDEKQAIFEFYEKVGIGMGLTERPTSLREAYLIINNYVNSDESSQYTSQGKVLTDSIHKIVEQWYGLFLPKSLIQNLLNAVIYVDQGKKSFEKLGLPMPSQLSLYVLYTLASVRRFVMHFVPPRKDIKRLSDQLMKQDYKCPLSKTNILRVGPPKVISNIAKTASQ